MFEPHKMKVNLDTWMGDLPYDVKQMPLIKLSIPGSHNSGTNDLSGKAGHDAFCINVPIFARPWAQCQRVPISLQLENGIRYLDFRLDFDKNKNKFFVTHFLRSKSSPKKSLESIKDFLADHPSEIVFIDFQHYYNFSISLRNKFLAHVLDLFGNMVCPKPCDNCTLSLSYLQENQFQVILIDRFIECGGCRKLEHFIFTSKDFPTFWPDTDNATAVIEKAKSCSRTLDGIGYITQLILTVQRAKNLAYLDLKKFYKFRMQRKAMEWLISIPGGRQPNIVITDFVDIQNYSFPRTVVSLNYLKAGESLMRLGFQFVSGNNTEKEIED